MSTDQESRPGGEPGEGLQGFMSNDDWHALLAEVSALIRDMEALPDEQTRRQIFELLQGIDAIHREGLTRLVRLFKEGVLEQVITDPPIHTLMELYDLLPQDLEQPASSPPAGQQALKGIPIKVVPKEAKKSTAAEPAHWVPVLQATDELSPGGVALIPADERELLLCRVGDDFFALDPRCPRDGGLLAGAQLTRYTLVCPHHEACYYDVRNGARVGGGAGIACYAVQIPEDDRVMVGFGVPFTPRLPAF